MVRKGKTVRASTVVEMAYLMPMVLLVWMLILFALFYYHDKNILGGAAYETAVLGSERAHDGEEASEEELAAYFQRRLRGKLLFFRGASVRVQVREEEIAVQSLAASKGMSLSIERKACVSRPERRIRRLRSQKQWVGDVIS